MAADSESDNCFQESQCWSGGSISSNVWGHAAGHQRTARTGRRSFGAEHQELVSGICRYGALSAPQLSGTVFKFCFMQTWNAPCLGCNCYAYVALCLLAINTAGHCQRWLFCEIDFERLPQIEALICHLHWLRTATLDYWMRYLEHSSSICEDELWDWRSPVGWCGGCFAQVPTRQLDTSSANLRWLLFVLLPCTIIPASLKALLRRKSTKKIISQRCIRGWW